MIIKQGYRITVTSWENDADHYQTHSVDGLDVRDVEFFVDFCKLHYSQNAWKTEKGMGNMYEPSDSERNEYISKAKAVFVKHRICPFLLQRFPDHPITEDITEDDTNDITHELAYEIFGGGEFYTRVFDGRGIVYVPEELEFEDVTKRFFK